MKLKDYIREGYNIVTSPNLAYKIQEDYPNALVFTDRALDAIPIGKLLVDRFYSNDPAVLSAKSLQNAYAIERFSCEFTGYKIVAQMTGETRRKVLQQINKRKDEPFIDEQDFNYPKVLIKTPHKDIEGCIKEVTFFYLDDHNEKFMVRSEREDYVTGKKIGAHFATSIKEVEANDWYMKIVHDGKTLYETEPNLLEIKLKDTDSVPEVYYKGERLDELPKGLVDVSYHWKTDGFSSNDRGANDITIQYFSSFNDMYPDMKTIGYKREI